MVWVLYINFTETIRHIQHNIVKHTHAGGATAGFVLPIARWVMFCCADLLFGVVRGFKVRGSKRWFSPNGIANGWGNAGSTHSTHDVALRCLGRP